MVQCGKEKCAAHVIPHREILYTPLYFIFQPTISYYIVTLYSIPKEGVAKKSIVSTGENNENTSIYKMYVNIFMLFFNAISLQFKLISTVLSPRFRNGAGTKSDRVGPMSEKRPIHQHNVKFFLLNTEK